MKKILLTVVILLILSCSCYAAQTNQDNQEENGSQIIPELFDLKIGVAPSQVRSEMRSHKETDKLEEVTKKVNDKDILTIAYFTQYDEKKALVKFNFLNDQLYEAEIDLPVLLVESSKPYLDAREKLLGKYGASDPVQDKTKALTTWSKLGIKLYMAQNPWFHNQKIWMSATPNISINPRFISSEYNYSKYVDKYNFFRDYNQLFFFSEYLVVLKYNEIP